LARALRDGGYGFPATRGTAGELRADGHAVTEVARLGEHREGVPDILEGIRSGRVSLVVYTPSPTSGQVRAAAAIRHAAMAEGVLCLTSVDTAIAAARSIDPRLRERLVEVRALAEWTAESAVPA